MRLLIQLLKLINLRLSNLLIRLDPPDLSGVEWPPGIKASGPQVRTLSSFGGVDVKVYLDGVYFPECQSIRWETLSDKSASGELVCVDFDGLPSLFDRSVTTIELRAANEYGNRATRTLNLVSLDKEYSSFSVEDVVFDRKYTFFAKEDHGWKKL